MPLRAARLMQDLACPSLRDVQAIDHVIDRPASTRRAHKFGLAASRRIAMSIAWLATMRLSRAFSASSSFMRLLDHGEARPELITADSDLAERIAGHPLIAWKAQNVRQHRGEKP